MPDQQCSAKVRELVPLLMVQDINRSAAFYRHQLGFEFAGQWEPSEGRLAWCRLERDGSAVMLQLAEEEDGPTEGRGHGVCFYFHCDDVDAMYAELSQRGLQLSPPQVAFYGMKQVFLQDPDGYQFCFQSSSGSEACAE